MPNEVLTPEQRAELKRLCEQATPGPWYWRKKYELYDGTHWALHSPESEAKGRVIGLKTVAFDHFTEPAKWHADPDVSFIAAARTALPSLLQEVESLERERDDLFCDAHRPNQSKKYAGCLVCSRNEDAANVEEVLKSLGWAHCEEAELYLPGWQWYCIGEEERGTWDTSTALTKALEDYDALREAHKKARLAMAKEQSRAESAESALRAQQPKYLPNDFVEILSLYIPPNVAAPDGGVTMNPQWEEAAKLLWHAATGQTFKWGEPPAPAETREEK